MDTSSSNDAAEEAPPPVQDDAAETEPLDTFPTPSYADWEELVRAKEKDPARALVTELEEGIVTQWLYGPDDAPADDPGGLPGEAPFVRGIRTGSPWAIRQRNAATTVKAANAQILEELEGGASEILLAIDPAGVAGVPVSDVEMLDAVLDGVYLDLAPIALEGDPAGADLLLELYRRREIDPAEVVAFLRLDPIGSAVVDMETAIAKVSEVHAEFPRVRTLAVDTAAYAEAGAGGVLELALALSTGVAYLRAGEACGVDADAIAASTEFTVAVGPDQFLEIARLRALRRCWARVLESCGVEPQRRRSALYVRTSRRMVSSLDPWVNILRDTTAAFAGAVGGADGVTVLAFDEPYGLGVTTAGPLGRRIARNTQLLLSEESSLHRVADPAGGSWYVESLTDQIASAAWKEFQALEASGGIVALLDSGELATRLAEATRARQGEIARRKRSLTGINQFPLLGEDGVEREGAASPPVYGTGDDDDVLGLTRDAAQFEALRARASGIDGARILLATTGPLASHVNVAQWAKSFFEAGGVETIPSGVDADIRSLVEENDIRAAAVCIGKDSDPGPTVEALRDAGVERLFAVGGELEGIERVKDGVDMIAVLSALLDSFGEDQ